MPRISIVLPCFNVEQFVELALESVLAQTEPDFELLLIENGSTDRTAELIEPFLLDKRIKITRLAQNIGAANAYALGLRQAEGEFVVFMGADDAVEPEYLQSLLEGFSENVGMVTCHIKCMDEAGKEIEPPTYLKAKPTNIPLKAWKAKFFHAGHAGFGSPMFRREVLNQIGGSFDESFKQLSDLELYLRVVDAGHGIHVVEKPLYHYRLRPNQASAPTQANADVHVAQLDRIRQKHYFSGKKAKIMIATPFYENKGYSPYIRAMFQTVYTLARHTTLEFDFQEVSGGSYIDHNRNLMADAFLESDATHLFFIDSDESWDIKGFLNILKADVEVVGAAYPVKNNWENYGVEIFVDEANGFRPVVNEQGLIKASKVPTGFMKINRSVFEKIRAANPQDWYYHGEHKRIYNFFGHLTIDHVRYGEDISFNIRWQRIGGELWVEPRVNMGHYGVQEWLGNYDSYLRKQPGGDLELKAA